MNPFFVTDFSISDSLKTVRKSVLIYETIIVVDSIMKLDNEKIDKSGYYKIGYDKYSDHYIMETNDGCGNMIIGSYS